MSLLGKIFYFFFSFLKKQNKSKKKKTKNMSERTYLEFANSLGYLINEYKEFETFEYRGDFNDKMRKLINEKIYYIAPECMGRGFGLICDLVHSYKANYTDHQYDFLNLVIDGNLKFDYSLYKAN